MSGSFSYSKVVAVHREAAFALLLYPNPTSDNIHIEFDAPKNTAATDIACK